MNFPITRFFEYDNTEIASPVGTRHLPGGHAAFVQQLSFGCATSNPLQPATTSGTLNFRGPTFEIFNGIIPSHTVTGTQVLTINLANSGVAISDMRLYLADDTALTIPADSVGQDPAFVQFTTNSAWQQNLSMPSGTGTRMSLVVPSEPNVLRQDGANLLAGQDDRNSSEFIYMNAVVPWGFPFGSFGACGSGILRFTLLFNYYSNDFILEFGDP